MADIDIPGLITRFEREMEIDCHNNPIKVSRSDAARALIDIGRESLYYVISHLEANPPDKQLEIHICWAMLMHDIVLRVKRTEVPTTYEDTLAWILWAKKEFENFSLKPRTSEGVCDD